MKPDTSSRLTFEFGSGIENVAHSVYPRIGSLGPGKAVTMEGFASWN